MQHYPARLVIQKIDFKFSVPVSTETSKGDKLLKMPLDSISGSLISSCMGGMPPDLPSIGMLYIPVCFTHYENTYPS